MSQKDMQATKAPEPSPKATPEVKYSGTKMKTESYFTLGTCYQAPARSNCISVRSGNVPPLLVSI